MTRSSICCYTIPIRKHWIELFLWQSRLAIVCFNIAKRYLNARLINAIVNGVFLNLPPHVPLAAPAFDPTGPAPMKIGLMRRAPLSPAERQRRIVNNLCRYCGGQDNQLANCPLVSFKPKSKSNIADVQGKAHRQ